jgi:hypothetical protein
MQATGDFPLELVSNGSEAHCTSSSGRLAQRNGGQLPNGLTLKHDRGPSDMLAVHLTREVGQARPSGKEDHGTEHRTRFCA